MTAPATTVSCSDCGAHGINPVKFWEHVAICPAVEPCAHCGTEFATKGEEQVHRNYRYDQCMASPKGEGHEVTGGKRGNCYYVYSCPCGVTWSVDSSD